MFFLQGSLLNYPSLDNSSDSSMQDICGGAVLPGDEGGVAVYKREENMYPLYSTDMYSLFFGSELSKLCVCTCSIKEHRLFKSIYIKERCLSVCLFVCSDLEPKLLDGSLPNLA